jgi:hypothetical protein
VSAVLKASKIMRVSRAHPGVFARYHRGDPGFLDGLWNGIKGAVGGLISGGPAGAIVGGVAGLAGGKKASSGGGFFGTALTQMRGFAPDGPSILSPQINIGNRAMPGGAPVPGLPSMPPMFSDPNRGNTTQGGTSGGTDWDMGSPANGRRCNVGHHWNKSGYYTKRYGYIPKGTVCVKNRKRNPLNPRAASRALSRLTSTRKAMKGIERLMNRIGGSKPARFVASSGRRKKGCGCR